MLRIHCKPIYREGKLSICRYHEMDYSLNNAIHNLF